MIAHPKMPNWKPAHTTNRRIEPWRRSSAFTDSWMIVANVDDDKVSTEEARRAVGQEAQAIAQEFFDLGSSEESIAAVKLRPFATRTSFATFLEMGHFKLGG